MESGRPSQKLTIIGGGIIGLLEAYFAHREAKAKGTSIRVTIHEKNASIADTTASNIAPSLTPDEMLSVVPRGPALVEKLGILFNEPGGIRVDDVKGAHTSSSALEFIAQVQQDSIHLTEAEYCARSNRLLAFGARSMQLWQEIFDKADAELKKIMLDSNFQPCREPLTSDSVLHEGFRIDLIYDVPSAISKATAMQDEYKALGFPSSITLSPAEVMARDPSLIHFCRGQSTINSKGEMEWKSTAAAVWRPGGCIDTQAFLPKLQQYLEKHMGTYQNESGASKNCFRMKFNKNVEAVTYDSKTTAPTIDGLRFFGNPTSKHNKYLYKNSEYVFCPGEAVGTLKKLGFQEPPYTGFAGPSLRLNIPIPPKELKNYAEFNHCMEVHKEGVVLAWQARRIGNNISIKVAGTKAFYGEQKPHINHAFALERNLLQLQMINDVLSGPISWALDRDTSRERLTAKDLFRLEKSGIATRWVGTRAVAFDNSPTLGPLYNAETELQVTNARTTTHLGSGGVSFGPAAVFASRKSISKSTTADPVVDKILKDSRSNRRYT